MPVIALFDGIKLEMYFNDHAPPHVHAKYAEYEVLITIQEATVHAGYLPTKKLKQVQPKLIRIRELLDVQLFQLICRWSNGEVRINDLTKEVSRWQKSRNWELAQLADPDKFKTAFAQSGTIAFAGVLVDTGDMGFQPLDLDPDVLFAESLLLIEPVKEPIH